jgi:outer membrane protein assembly factor BamB
VIGLDPAKGTLLWRYVIGNQFNAVGSNPVWADNTLFASAAYGGGSAAFTLVRSESEWQTRTLWQSKKALQTLFATSIVHKGHVYGVNGDISAITLRCLDLKTGDVKWSERWPARSTLLGADGHLIILDEKGTLYLVEMDSGRLALKATLPKVLAPKAWAAPALADGRLYLRDQRHVVCLDLRRQ